MPTISKEILENLGDIVKQFHTALTKGGAEGIKAELANCKCSNPFGMGVILSKWDNVLYKLDNVANKLKKVTLMISLRLLPNYLKVLRIYNFSY